MRDREEKERKKKNYIARIECTEIAWHRAFRNTMGKEEKCRLEQVYWLTILFLLSPSLSLHRSNGDYGTYLFCAFGRDIELNVMFSFFFPFHIQFTSFINVFDVSFYFNLSLLFSVCFIYSVLICRGEHRVFFLTQTKYWFADAISHTLTANKVCGGIQAHVFIFRLFIDTHYGCLN